MWIRRAKPQADRDWQVDGGAWALLVVSLRAWLESVRASLGRSGLRDPLCIRQGEAIHSRNGKPKANDIGTAGIGGWRPPHAGAARSGRRVGPQRRTRQADGHEGPVAVIRQIELQKQKSPRLARCARRGLHSLPMEAALLPHAVSSEETAIKTSFKSAQLNGSISVTTDVQQTHPRIEPTRAAIRSSESQVCSRELVEGRSP